ncbi:amino acid ABC transporter permease [Ligilactobacillus equi]|uniref:Glutamine transport system permease n=2 Tax=Ligilactobacillus equi TaxID=137357 RepID=V7HZF8_9LACO|nr:amino acid ABC transporter permease [Ligilactobacillus equi]ETA74396.1 glutamine transport system permease [Ligilactobacillus equi DPC 6820]KRL79463.1 glutamate transport membrane-spanning protein [Ligilactobacillus equi DSM 15833 = JCM 10991]MCQ2556524.1 amino acid ABC transporter permease [Ligilactobacillus sp.]
MIEILSTNGQAFLTGFLNTVFCSLLALIFSLIIGAGMAILETLPSKFWSRLAHAYVELFRNIPLLVITMFLYVVVPKYVMPLSGFAAGTIGLTLYTSSFIAETVRAGIQSIDVGQMEGARANGLTYWQAMQYIILPQAFKIVIPPLGNQFINLIKNSSVLAFVAGFDLMYQGDIIAATNFRTIETYIVVGVLYLILTLPMSYYMRYLEKKLA